MWIARAGGREFAFTSSLLTESGVVLGFRATPLGFSGLRRVPVGNELLNEGRRDVAHARIISDE
ncbi:MULTISPECIES: hypothetical protein [Mycobacterium]|uniref:Uncharacterized protein n=1 Tax=Mycobacterium colombiense TaxID=339268 RepID=A0A329M749_9MYCO|nr:MULTISPECIES: hypothetical protein [Mycobacterium]MDM4138571.1 hypothetical protein [Mycobacterium sp. FLAC0960]RAV16009.1 hypothetical protein DQP57_03840 [Mycobacterium colombiense]